MKEYMAEEAMKRLHDYDQAEVYVSDTKIDTVYIDDSEISNVETKRDLGMMFRMTRNGRMGKASVTLSGPDSEEQCLDMAETVLSFSPSSKDLEPYAQPSQAKISRPDVLDKKVVEITPDDLREIARQVIDASGTWKGVPVKIPRAQIRVATTSTHTVNSNGVDVKHESTLVYGHFTSMCVRDHPGEGIETFHGTHLNLDAGAIGRRIAEKAYDASVCKEFKGRMRPTLIMTPGDGSEMILSSLGEAVNGENVRYGRSIWKDSVGGQVASRELSITDDPTADAPLSCVFDDEGTATQRRPVIEEGVLRGFVRDSFCGDSTGNGMRRSSIEAQGAYERTPTIKPLNYVVRPGRYSLDDMVAQTDEGIIVDKFAAADPDSLSGSFALNVRCGHVVKNGEIVGVINNALCMGNMFECAKNISMIGNDPVQTGVMELPTICYEGTELVGN